jgi:hypothetical protein
MARFGYGKMRHLSTRIASKRSGVWVVNVIVARFCKLLSH